MHRSTRRRLALVVGALVLAGTARLVRAGEEDLALAERVRPGIVRLRWRSFTHKQHVVERNAIVVRDDGLLLMAGPPSDGRTGAMTAQLADGAAARVEVVATDSRTALSLLRIHATNLQPLTIQPAPRAPNGPGPDGVSPVAEAAAPVESLPLGMAVVMVSAEGAVASGAIRAQDRPATYADPTTGRRIRTTGLVEASMAVLASDLGAPWFDAQGRVVGLIAGGVTSVTPERRDAARERGLELRAEPTAALAVPASVIRVVLPLLLKYGHVPRAALGVHSRPASAAVRQHLLEGHGGHVIHGVDPGGAAQKAGLRAHDIIASIEGRHLRPTARLHDVLLPYRPGARIRLGLLREGERIETRVQLGHGR